MRSPRLLFSLSPLTCVLIFSLQRPFPPLLSLSIASSYASFPPSIPAAELNYAQDEFNTQAGLKDEQIERMEAMGAEEDRHRGELLPRGSKAPDDFVEDMPGGKGTSKEKRDHKIRSIQAFQMAAVSVVGVRKSE